MKEVFEPYKIIKSKRHRKTLKKLLMRAIYTDVEDNPKVLRRNRLNYGLCLHLIEFNLILTNISCDVELFSM